MKRRNIHQLLVDGLEDSPVVLLHGARQTGKTTLARQLAEERSMAVLTLDRAATLAAARRSPEEFIAGLPGAVVLDEVQRAPELFPAIKLAVDADRAPGRFLLTGSANILLLPRLSESLAGRMEILTLRPFAQCELEGTEGNLLGRLFDAERIPGLAPPTAPELWERVLRGGYPPVQTWPRLERRADWFDSYVTTILERDVRDLYDVGDLTALTRLLQLLASRIGGLVNHASLSRESGIPQTTLTRYFELLQKTFLVTLLPAWSGNLGKRLIKASKLYLLDTGLIAGILAIDGDRLLREDSLRGRLLENFVVAELAKLASWTRPRARLYHFRSHTGLEVDFLLERPDGRIVAIEVKASSAVDAPDFRPLQRLAELLGGRLLRRVVLYAGTEALAFGPNDWALPYRVLWSR